MVKTIEYIDGVVRMIDQTRLPNEKVFVDCKTVEDVGHAIKTMIIRGAPAIGVAAAMGISLAAGKEQGVPLFAASAACELFQAGISMFPGEDNQCVAKFLEQIAGAEVRW